jgi:hypothetical protein
LERSHDELWAIRKTLPTDFEPYGLRSRYRETGGPDCSCGCAWYHTLIGQAQADWGICANPASPRAGLLTFEHQGCELFENEPSHDSVDDNDEISEASPKPNKTSPQTQSARRIKAESSFDIDAELPNGIAPILSEQLGADPSDSDNLAQLVKEYGSRYLSRRMYVTSRADRLAPFIGAYGLCLFDVSEILALPVPYLAQLIKHACIDLRLEGKRGYRVTLKEDEKHNITYPHSLTFVHPQTGQKYHANSLGGLVLENSLSHLATEINRRNLSTYLLPKGLSEKDWWVFAGDRTIVTDSPEEYLSVLSLLNCRVIDVSRVMDLSPPEVADRIYLAWTDLKLREQASCHVVLKKEGAAGFFYAHQLDRIEE